MNREYRKDIAVNAMIACLYAVLTICISPIAYGGIQMRLTEVMVLLSFYHKRYIIGLVIGCLIANMFSPMGIWDMCFGTIATFLACISIYYSKKLYIAAFFGSIINGLIVGLELYFALSLPFWLNAFYVFIGEWVVLLIGVKVFQYLEKNETLMEKYIK